MAGLTETEASEILGTLAATEAKVRRREWRKSIMGWHISFTLTSRGEFDWPRRPRWYAHKGQRNVHMGSRNHSWLANLTVFRIA